MFAATLSITSEQIKNKSRRDLKYVITKTLEEKLDDEKRTEEQKCGVFKQILEDLNYYNLFIYLFIYLFINFDFLI